MSRAAEIWYMLLQAPLLCEVASHLAQLSELGKRTARRFMRMAASWAHHFEAEMRVLGTAKATPDTDASQLLGLLQTKSAIAHCCAILCMGWASGRGGDTMSTTPRVMDHSDARMLCLHRSQAHLRTFQDGSNDMQGRLAALTAQCQAISATLIHAMNAAARADPGGVLNPAVRRVFGDLPDDVPWQPIQGHLGCYMADVRGQIYSVNLLSGCVLCNGAAPGHLPAPLLQHAEYKRLFGDATFEVRALKGEQQGKFSTVQSVGGFLYTLRLHSGELHVEECPINADTGALELEQQLDLLPCADP